MVVAGHQHVTGERHVGLCEGEQRGPFAPLGALVALAVACDGLGFLVLLLALGGGTSAALVGSKNPVGLGRLATSARWLAACPASWKPALSPTRGSVARVPRSTVIRLISAFCSVFTSLVNWNSTGSYALPSCFTQSVDHLQRAVVVRDHQGQEQAVEVGTLQGREPGHVGGRGHAGHGALHVHPAMHRRIRHALAALAQPILHEGDLVGLRRVDPPGHRHQLGQVGAVFHQLGHLHGLIMVIDHVAHEGDVIDGVAGVGELDRLLRRQPRGLLTRRARLNDGNVLHGRGARGGQEQHDPGDDERARCATDAVMVHRGFSVW